MKAKTTAKSRLPHTAAKRQTRSCRIPRPGQKCPQCGKGQLDYDGLLNLICPACGYAAISGSFT